MAGTAEDVIRAAESQLGNTNGAKYFEYFGYPDLGPFCVAGDRWSNEVAGVDFPWDAFYAWDESDVPQAYRVSKWDAPRGASMSFDWDWDGAGDHVGIVLSRQDWGLSTIEFNTGNPGTVAYRQRVWDVCVCGILPHFADSKPEDTKIAVDGDVGHATVRAWQRQMGTDPDGVLSDQLWDHDQYRRAVTAIEHYWLDYQDWGYQGSSLVKAVQRLVGVTADGDWGYNTTCAIQRKLREWGYYEGGIDGDFGYHSAACLQRSINDGKWA